MSIQSAPRTLTIAIAAIAVAVFAAAVPAGASDNERDAPVRVIVRQDAEDGGRPTFEVAHTDQAGFDAMMANPNIDAELDGYGEIYWRPSDPDYGDQWEHHIAGIETAWDTTRGDSEIVIAIVDSGVAPHPEFGDRLLPGASFLGGDPHVDPLGHGTAVASVAAGGADNGTGGVGACPNCTILPVQVADTSGAVPWSAAASGIVWAVDQGADILNLSFGGQMSAGVLADAVQYAIDSGVVVIAAAGNHGTTTEVYPASLPGVISAAAHRDDFTRYSWSSHGDWVDVAAPGCAHGLLADSFELVCGTSFAAPWTSGLVALMLTENGPLSQGQVETALQNATSSVDFVETGAIDASVLLSGGFADLGDVRSRVGAREVELAGEYRGDVVQVDLLIDGNVADSDGQPADGEFHVMWDASEAETGFYTVQVDAHDSDGGVARSRALVVEVIDGSGFTDVSATAFYGNAVAWMVAEGITTGTGPSTFSPDDNVTRAQLATFLHRYAGEPSGAPTASFSDTDPGAYYAAGVAWMVDQGITNGTSPTTFSPDDDVTRGQLAAFLHRFEGSLAVGSQSSFADVDRGAYYAVAVDFLVERGVTTGTSPSTFSPDSPVTRGQLATFLWRLAGEPVM